MDSDEDSDESRILLRYGTQADETQYNISNITDEKASTVASISDILADKYEAALESTGFGPFSLYLLLFCGITLMADTTEILCVSFVMPSAEKDLCLSDWVKGLIGSVIFLGE